MAFHACRHLSVWQLTRQAIQSYMMELHGPTAALHSTAHTVLLRYIASRPLVAMQPGPDTCGTMTALPGQCRLQSAMLARRSNKFHVFRLLSVERLIIAATHLRITA